MFMYSTGQWFGLSYKSSACEALSENVLQFERRSKQRNVVSLTTVRNIEGTLSTNDTETSQILCDQFQQVYANQEYVGLCSLVPISAEDLFTEEYCLRYDTIR